MGWSEGAVGIATVAQIVIVIAVVITVIIRIAIIAILLAIAGRPLVHRWLVSHIIHTLPPAKGLDNTANNVPHLRALQGSYKSPHFCHGT